MYEWANEPNYVEFEASGFSCVIHRHPELGHLCGYIGVPKEMAGGLTDQTLPNVHWAWTWWSNRIPKKEPDGKVWFGFDCGHHGDLIPMMPEAGGIYRNITFVREELERVATELKEKLCSS